jgi:hypothetical protein
METKKRIYLTQNPDGSLDAVAETTTCVLMRNVDVLLSQFLQDQTVVIPLSKVERLYYTRHGDERYMFIGLPALHLRTTYQIVPGAELCTPTWGLKDVALGGQDPKVAPQADVELSWTPPDGVSLWLIHGVLNGSWWMVAVLHDPATKKTHIRKLPVGNTFSDSTMCMGDDMQEVVSTFTNGIGQCPNIIGTGGGRLLDVVTYLKAAREYFDTSSWNNDLETETQRNKSSKLFLWNLADMKQMPVTIDTFMQFTWPTSGPYERDLQQLVNRYLL